MNTKLNMGVIEDKSITYSKLADDVAESINATLTGSAPDWNAQEGEAGYIGNRPCYVNLNNGHRITLDNADITLSSDENWYEKIIIPINEFKISLYYYNLYEGFIHYVLTEGQSVFDYHFGCKFTAVLNEYNSCDLLLTDFGDTKEYVDTTFAKTKLVYDYNDNVVQKLDSMYLPDTVLKTTPQTLSDAEKNQVKENLGISNPDWNTGEDGSGVVTFYFAANFTDEIKAKNKAAYETYMTAESTKGVVFYDVDSGVTLFPVASNMEGDVLMFEFITTLFSGNNTISSLLLSCHPDGTIEA